MKALFLASALAASMVAGIGIGWTASEKYGPREAPGAVEVMVQQRANRALAVTRADGIRDLAEAVEALGRD
jgi:hypothetical protein